AGAAMPSFAELAEIEKAARSARPEAEVVSFAALAETMKPSSRPVADGAPRSSAGESGAEPETDRRVGPEDRRGIGIQSIRVGLDKVDRVVNMVGELVITQSMLSQKMDETLRSQYQELVRGLEVLAQTTRGLQDAVMSIRAQPVKTVFSRMPRLVREL